jgi:hypothetical protein
MDEKKRKRKRKSLDEWNILARYIPWWTFPYSIAHKNLG